MKKLIFAILFLTTNAYADVITIENISNDNVATSINTNFSRLSTLQSGNIEGSCDGGSTACNVKADSVYRVNMADDADPATFAKETLQITVDTVGSEGSYSYSGCVPADDTDLTSDISACVSYINGIRVSKSATANTYTANRDCYVDLSQTGVYTTTCVTNGAAEPVVAANSGRLAKVVTDGTEITTITDLRNTRLPGLLIPSHYRSGMVVSKDSTTTLKVLPGTVEINNTMVNKTSATTLTISTAGDYAGGTSLRAASTYGYVGIDDDGNLKLHTTAPTHDNYGVSTTAGKKRYATWSSTVYRILGWFYMDGAQLVENASNIKEFDVNNIIMSNDTAVTSLTSTLTEVVKSNFYNSGGAIQLHSVVSLDNGTTDKLETKFRRGTTDIEGSGNVGKSGNAGQPASVTASYVDFNRPQGTNNYSVMASTASTINMRRRSIIVEES